MGDLVRFPVPSHWRRYVVIAIGGGVLVAAAWFGGRYTAPAKVETRTVTVEKSVRDEAAIASAVAQARAEWQQSVQDHTVTQTRTVYVQGKPVEKIKIVYVDRESQSGGSFDASSVVSIVTVTREETAKATETTRTETGAGLPGWSASLGLLWTPAKPTKEPTRLEAGLERRLFGTLWLGASVHADIATKPDVRAGARARIEW